MNSKKYNFPIQIFICFEKLNFSFYTSNVLYKNHFFFFFSNNFYYGLNLFLKNEVFLNFLNLTELSAIDTLKYNEIGNLKIFNKNNNIIQFNIYYLYFNKIRITSIVNTNKKIKSIEKIFNNASWLEREASEMFNIKYLKKKDDRSLLLDYSRNEYPMLKDFPCEGFYEIYFNFFENKLNYVKSEMIEL